MAGGLQTSALLLPGPGYGPAGAIPTPVQRHEIHLGVARGRPAAQEETGVALRQHLLLHVPQPHVILLRQLRSRRTGEKGEAHGIQQRGFSRPRRTGYGVDTRRSQRLFRKINGKLSFQRRQIASSDRQHSHKETSLITSLNNVSISTGNSPPYFTANVCLSISSGAIFCKSLYDKALSSASPSRRGYEGTMEVRRTAFPTNASSTRWRNVGSGSVSKTRIST